MQRCRNTTAGCRASVVTCRRASHVQPTRWLALRRQAAAGKLLRTTTHSTGRWSSADYSSGSGKESKGKKGKQQKGQQQQSSGGPSNENAAAESSERPGSGTASSAAGTGPASASVPPASSSEQASVLQPMDPVQPSLVTPPQPLATVAPTTTGRSDGSGKGGENDLIVVPEVSGTTMPGSASAGAVSEDKGWQAQSAPWRGEQGGSQKRKESDDDESDKDDDGVTQLKQDLLSQLVSLDRGVCAKPEDAERVDGLVRQLEEEQKGLTLSWIQGGQKQSTMDLFDGNWRLIYTSAFRTGSAGGRRPGPPFAVLPLTLGQIYQTIDSSKMELDNVVEFFGAYEAPFLPRFETPTLRARLRHSFTTSSDARVTINFINTEVQFVGGGPLEQLPKLSLPALPDFVRPMSAARFDVTYLDGTMRVTRGDRGELRIYLRDSTLSGAARRPLDADEVAE